jgi:nucleoside-diphosphate-sugar epimerase
MKKKILITGISGFLGSKLAFSLKNEFEIHGISKSKSKINSAYKVYIGNLKNAFFVKSIKESFFAIINCAANTNHFEEYNKSYSDNCVGLKNILLSENIRYKKFLHISTEAVFLGLGKINVDEFTNFPKKNISTYSTTKKKAELIFKKFNRKNSTNIIIRTRLIWDSKKSPIFFKIKDAIRKKKFLWVSNGNYLTVATHVQNLTLGIKCALKYGKNDQTYFITDRKIIKFKKLIESIIKEKINAFSIPRILIYILCILGDIFARNNILKSKNPILSMSTYYLIFSEVHINDNYSSKQLNYFPKNYYN